MTSEWELVGRVALASVFGLAIGFERELRPKPAGVRTHMLVAAGSAAFIAGSLLVSEELAAGDSGLNADQVRVAAGIVAGVGFLGAGAIMRTGVGVQGLTTAAGVWLTAAVGILVGSGFYITAIGATVVAVIIQAALYGLGRIRPRPQVEQAEP